MPRDQRGAREHDRVVIHHQRAECRHRLGDALDPCLVQAPGQRQDPRAEPPVDGVAELDDEPRIAGGQYLVRGHKSLGTTINGSLIFVNLCFTSIFAADSKGPGGFKVNNILTPRAIGFVSADRRLRRRRGTGISHRSRRLRRERTRISGAGRGPSRLFVPITRIAAMQVAGADRRRYARLASAGCMAGGRRSPNRVASQ